jgi:hypothetical protein
MRTTARLLGSCAGVAVVLVGVLAGCTEGEDPAMTTTTTGPDVNFNVNLTGVEEVPGPGDDDGTGAAMITLHQGGSDVCATISVDGLAGEVTGAHIHEGRAGTAGPIAVTLPAPTSGSAEGCVGTSTSIVDALATGTRAFYVNVHTDEFPDGAVRAQLTGTG